MFKLFYVIFMNLHRAPYIIPLMRNRAMHPERYTDEQRYALVHHVIYLMNKTGKISTKAFGVENLPKEGGYMRCIRTTRENTMCSVLCTHMRNRVPL